jgi:sodium-dependent dicarboxylate transporter 2/3/5
MSPVFFFVLAMFCLAGAMVQARLDRRLAFWLLARAGNDTRRVLLALMAGTGAISTIISDVPACALFMAIALGVMTQAGVAPGSTFGKAIMIGVPFASLIGGVATPAGSSVNIIGMHFIEQYGKVRVPFVSWMALGIPMVIVLLPTAWWALLRTHPPEMARIGSNVDFDADRAALGPWTSVERKTMALLVVMLTLWIAGSWVPALDVVLVAIAGTVVMFLPGVRLLTWKQAERAIGWDTLLMIGGVTALGAASVETGLAKWLVDSTLGDAGGWPVWIAVAAIGTFTLVIHLVLTIGPVVNAVIIPPVVLLALSAEQSPAMFGLPVAFTASAAFLLPLDAVSLITYSRGYYRMLDMLKPGLIVSAVWIVWMTILTLILVPWLGLG